jgi:hypothetical protein
MTEDHKHECKQTGEICTLKERARKLADLLDEELDDATGARRKPVSMSVLTDIHALLEEIGNLL